MQPYRSYYAGWQPQPAAISGTMSLAAVLGGGSLALFVMVGRWTPSRVWGGVNWMLFTPRAWAVIGLAVAVVAALMTNPTRTFWTRAERSHLLRGVAFLAYLALSATWSRAGAFAVEKAELLLLVIVAMLLTAALIHKLGDPFVKAYWMWYAFATSVYALFTIETGWLASRKGTIVRNTPLAGGPNVFARLTAMLAVASLNFGTRGGRWVFWYGPAALAVLLTIGSGSRGGLLAGTCGLIALGETRGLLKRRGVLPALLLVGVLVAGAIGTQTGERTIEVFQNRVIKLAFEKGDDSGRVRLLKQAINIGNTAPLVGSGLGGFFYVNRNETYSHNIFTEAYSEGGLIGVGLLAWMFVGAFASLAANRNTDLGAVTWAAYITIFVACQFSGDMFDSRLVFLLPLMRPFQPPAVQTPHSPQSSAAPW